MEQNEDEEAEKKKKSHIEREVLHRCSLTQATGRVGYSSPTLGIERLRQILRISLFGFGVSGNGFDRAGSGVAPERMGFALALQITAVPAEVLEQAAPFH
ncbi:MAG: hypothetical protein MPW14_08600 [Candidatus Manganitrophus sp.]|nr:hypothetical protein [Candidatus Manganitrophus sp.]MDC4227883.1 hypothetical protein [Candidatus Manganitrophus sp.]WDT70968.1 MAG: hypothetical protein MPW17_19825 [Candidatus Manganitrophus sp.]WDT81757.1 MAG: hypothetical protein MPW14_08600 [Candidatus Manganitrophus sp.]